MPHSFAPSAISHQPRNPPHFLFKTATEGNGCGKTTSTWDSSTQIVDNNLEHLILKQSLHPNLSPSQSSPYIFQRTPSQIRARLPPDTNASAPRFERVWELIRMRLPPDADVPRPAFAKKYRRRNKQKDLKPPVYRASYEKSQYKRIQKPPTRPFLQSVYQENKFRRFSHAMA